MSVEEGPAQTADGSASRICGNNRHASAEVGELPDFVNEWEGSDVAHRSVPLSVEPGQVLREEATQIVGDGSMQARPWGEVVGEWRDWYDGYLRSHAEYRGPDGEIARSRLKNSYMPEYGRRYYAKLKDLEEGIEREFEGLTTVMLTDTASNENDEGMWRCPADHMRDVMEGYDAQRKMLHKVLDGWNWEYARIWEPHQSGYGHLHIAVFVEDPDDEIEASTFEPAMESYVANCAPAGMEAHENRSCSDHDQSESRCEDCHTPVSVVHGLEDELEDGSEGASLATYLCEYIGVFGDDALERPINEQMFYAVTWATRTRRVDFSNGAQDVIRRNHVRRRVAREFTEETGFRPEDCPEEFEGWREEFELEDDGGGMEIEAICTYRDGELHSRGIPPDGGAVVATEEIDGRPGQDRPPDR